MPKSANVAYTLGYVYYRKNLTSDAIRQLEMAVREDPKDVSFRLHLAMALLQQGDKNGARKKAEAVLHGANADQQ